MKGPKPKTIWQRLDDKFLIGDGCWPWTAAKYPNGYGHVEHEHRSLLAHKMVYELLRGPVPVGHDLDHRCHNEAPECPGGWACEHRACVNPWHMVPATRSANLVASGRTGGYRQRKEH